MRNRSKVSKGGSNESKGTKGRNGGNGSNGESKGKERKEERKRGKGDEETGAGQNMADKNFNGVQEFAFSQKNVSSQVRGQLFKWYFQFHLSHIFTQECSSLTTFFYFSLNFVSQFLRSNFFFFSF
jgi:hypothetical protein